LRRAGTSYPQRARADARTEARYQAAELGGKGPRHCLSAEQHIEVGVEGEKCLQEVLLGPVALTLDPPPRILPGQEDVVEVDEHARPQKRQHVEDDVVDITTGLDGVGRVDEQNVTVVEGLERG